MECRAEIIQMKIPTWKVDVIDLVIVPTKWKSVENFQILFNGPKNGLCFAD